MQQLSHLKNDVAIAAINLIASRRRKSICTFFRESHLTHCPAIHIQQAQHKNSIWFDSNYLFYRVCHSDKTKRTREEGNTQRGVSKHKWLLENYEQSDLQQTQVSWVFADGTQCWALLSVFFFLVIIRLNLTKLSKYFEIRIFTVIQFGQSDTAFHLWQHSCESNLNEIEKKNQKKKKFLGGKKIQNEILKGMTDNRIPEIGEWWLRCLKLFNALLR